MSISNLRVNRIIGTKFRNVKSVTTRDLTPAEIAQVAAVEVVKDCEGYWISKVGGAGWDTLLVVEQHGGLSAGF